MELIALDSNFTPLVYLNYIELQWNRKFYEVGDFSVQITADQYDSNAKYIMLKDRPELGIIQKVEYSEKNSGLFVQMSGFFAEKLLDEKIAYPAYSKANQTVENFFSGVWSKYINSTDLQSEYHLDIKKNLYPEITDRISKQTTGNPITELLMVTLQPFNISLKASLDYDENKIIFEIIKGRDLTQDNTEGNNFVIFSEYFGNLKEATYLEDNSNYKNYAIVQGAGEGSSRKTVIVDKSNGKTKRQLYVDARDLQKDDDMTDAEYSEQLRQRGLEKLLDTVNITNLETDIMANAGFEYIADYDLGDTVDISVNIIQKSFKAQIIEASEVISGISHNVTLTFGDKVPTIWKKARIR